MLLSVSLLRAVSTIKAGLPVILIIFVPAAMTQAPKGNIALRIYTSLSTLRPRCKMTLILFVFVIKLTGKMKLIFYNRFFTVAYSDVYMLFIMLLKTSPFRKEDVQVALSYSNGFLQ